MSLVEGEKTMATVEDPMMILEVAILDVLPGQAIAFEQAFAEAQAADRVVGQFHSAARRVAPTAHLDRVLRLTAAWEVG